MNPTCPNECHPSQDSMDSCVTGWNSATMTIINPRKKYLLAEPGIDVTGFNPLSPLTVFRLWSYGKEASALKIILYGVSVK